MMSWLIWHGLDGHVPLNMFVLAVQMEDDIAAAAYSHYHLLLRKNESIGVNNIPVKIMILWIKEEDGRPGRSELDSTNGRFDHYHR